MDYDAWRFLQFVPLHVFTRALMKKGLRRSAAKTERECLIVFTRALMKKGLRPGQSASLPNHGGFHACPDEEGITTNQAGGFRRLWRRFHACPDEEGITTHGSLNNEMRAIVFTRALMKKGLRHWTVPLV